MDRFEGGWALKKNQMLNIHVIDGIVLFKEVSDTLKM